MAIPMWINKRSDIPNWIAVGIGRIAAEWSYIEWQFEEIIRLLLQVDITRGRLITFGMKTRTRAELIAPLARTMPETRSLANTALRIGAHAGELQSERDRLAHGLFGKIGRDWYVIKMKGSRPYQGKPLPRSELPEREKITQNKIRLVRSQFRKLRHDLDDLQAEVISALPPSPHKRPSQLRQGPL
jgi:hypothetical protein